MSFMHQESGSDLNFLHEMEKSLDSKKDQMTDFEWDLRNRHWEDQREKAFGHMQHNNIWTMLTQKHKGLESHAHVDRFLDEEPAEGQGQGQGQGPKVSLRAIGTENTAASAVEGAGAGAGASAGASAGTGTGTGAVASAGPGAGPGAETGTGTAAGAGTTPTTTKSGQDLTRKPSVQIAVDDKGRQSPGSLLDKPVLKSQQHASAVSNVSRIVWKVPKMNHLDLFKYLDHWDKSSYGMRDKIILEFFRTHDTKERLYDTDSVFHNGGSLIFARFAVGLHICFKKSRPVWHYYDALGIFVKSLQSDRYTEEFLKLGGMSCVKDSVRVQESTEKDKLHAFMFLENLMKSRNGHAVKQYVCDTPLFLESMIDSLTMCKSRELIHRCGQLLQTLCIEIAPKNVLLVCNFIMHALPCDFNPPLQAMAFKVLQSLVHLKPQLSTKCIKPLLDNLKGTNTDLLVEMSNLCIIILQTKYGGDLISSLMIAAEGIHMKESFRSTFQPRPSEQDITHENQEKDRLKQMKVDHYKHQAGALFVLNHVMAHKTEFIEDFISKGVYGLSLKTLGSCPHWEVQCQGVNMVKFLFESSIECAISYYLMLPPKMLEMIIEKPEESLRSITPPICVHLRKLGRFGLRMWDRWVEKVITVAKLYAKGPKIPVEIFQLSQMSRKVYEIHQAMADIIDNPAEQPKGETVHEHIADEREYLREFMDSSDEENIDRPQGKSTALGTSRFESYKSFVDDDDYGVPDDVFDHLDGEGGESTVSTLDGRKEVDAFSLAAGIMDDGTDKKKAKEGDGEQAEGPEGEGGEGGDLATTISMSEVVTKELNEAEKEADAAAADREEPPQRTPSAAESTHSDAKSTASNSFA